LVLEDDAEVFADGGAAAAVEVEGGVAEAQADPVGALERQDAHEEGGEAVEPIGHPASSAGDGGEDGGGDVAGGVGLAEGAGAAAIMSSREGWRTANRRRRAGRGRGRDGWRRRGDEHFGVAALLAGQRADDQHGGAGGHGFGGGQPAGLADEQAGAAHDGHGVLDVAADADGVLEFVAGGDELLAQAAVGAGDDVDGEIGVGAVELADGGEARAEAARAAHDEDAAAVFARDGAAARGEDVGLDGDAENVDAVGGRAEDHEALHGGFGGHDVADVFIGGHVPEAVGQEIGDDAPEGDGLALPAGVGGKDGEGMGLGADDGVGLEGVHQDAQLEAVAALDERADVAA
jgi:hypothetical protein